MPGVKPHDDVLPWWPAPRQPASDREPLTQQHIVDAALRLVDAEGIDALSMRRLGQELGAGATSLYWHVKNKDELLDLLVDAVIGEVALDDDPSSPWRERVAYLSRGLRNALRRHPAIAQIFGSRMTNGPMALRGIDYLVGILRSAGFEGERVALAFQVILNYASGFAIMESRPLTGRLVEGKTIEELQAMSVEMLASLPTDRFPNIAALADVASCLSDDAQFEYGLERLLDGIEADAARASERQAREDGGTAPTR